MTRDRTELFTSHTEMATLLPFLANGSLEEAERAAVTEHARSCVSCRRVLAFDQKLRADFAALTVGQQFERAAFQRLARRIKAEGAGGARDGARDETWLHAWSRLPTSLLLLLRGRPSLLAGAALTITLAATARLITIEQTPPPTYRTLASAQAISPTPSTTIEVVFREHIERARIEEILSTVHARVAAGPTAGGVYTLEIDIGATGEDTPLQALRALRQQPEVVLAELAPSSPEAEAAPQDLEAER
jgi:hypothetical protein